MMLANIFDLIGVKKGTYLDLGAHHPDNISNTALLYSKGWRGLNVDANPHVEKLFKEKRPEDKFLRVGVGGKMETRDFLMFHEHSGRNTFSKEESESWGGPPVWKKVPTEIVTLPYIIDMHLGGAWPNLINMDIEGLDVEVLESLAVPIDGPDVWCIECRPEQESTMKDILTAMSNYFCLCKMGVNLVFVRDEFESRLR